MDVDVGAIRVVVELVEELVEGLMVEVVVGAEEML